MKTVYTKNEFRRAMEAGERKIIIKGALAKSITNAHKAKKASKASLIGTAVAAAAAIPFTGGASLPVMGASLAGLTIGTVTISAAELAILCGLVLGAIALRKGYRRIKFNPDGSIEIEKD